MDFGYETKTGKWCQINKQNILQNCDNNKEYMTPFFFVIESCNNEEHFLNILYFLINSRKDFLYFVYFFEFSHFLIILKLIVKKEEIINDGNTPGSSRNHDYESEELENYEEFIKDYGNLMFFLLFLSLL